MRFGPKLEENGDKMSRASRLADRVAIVTGAARGIGRAVARKFAAEGAAVLCVDLNGQGVEETVQALKAKGGTASAFVGDVAAADEVLEAALGTYGGVDILHANAGVQIMGSLEATSPADWDRMYAVNQRAVAAAVRAVVPEMRRRGGGSIIFTASLLGIAGDANLAMYGATKGAVRALCRSVAVAYAGDNIRCNTICPGDVDTEMVREFFAYQSDPVGSRQQTKNHHNQ